MSTTAVDDLDLDREIAELEYLADRTATARVVYESIRGRRDRKLKELRAAGVPVERLRVAADLSHQRISQILNPKKNTGGGPDGREEEGAPEV